MFPFGLLRESFYSCSENTGQTKRKLKEPPKKSKRNYVFILISFTSCSKLKKVLRIDPLLPVNPLVIPKKAPTFAPPKASAWILGMTLNYLALYESNIKSYYPSSAKRRNKLRGVL